MSVRALTCDNHGFGSMREKCVACGKWPAANPALLCDSCGFGSGREKCCVCDNWPARNLAMVCDEHKGKCSRCGGSV